MTHALRHHEASGALCSIAAQLQAARLRLAPVARENAGLEARLLAAHAWGMTPEALVLYGEDVRATAPFEALVARRLAAEPVAQIVGHKDFWKARFAVTCDVLTPRADSETLLECLLRLRPQLNAAYRLLDLGTGSGCLLLSALMEYPQATGVAVDQSVAALAVATQNARQLGLLPRCNILRSNWCGALEGTFDVVLANPPYIPTAQIATLDADVRLYEPHPALDGGADGLEDYRRIVQQIRSHLNDHALLLFEVGEGQAEDVAALAQAAGFTWIEYANDLAGIARVVALEWKPNT